MSFVNLILGKREREPISAKKYPKPIARSEDVKTTTDCCFQTSSCSARTARDYEQAVGNLYEGYIEDEGEDCAKIEIKVSNSKRN